MISETHTTQALNSTSLMKSYARAPMTAAGRNAISTPMTKRRACRIVENADGELPQPHRIDRQQRQDGAELDQDGEALAEILVAEAEELLQQQKMPGRGDRVRTRSGPRPRRGWPP